MNSSVSQGEHPAKESNQKNHANARLPGNSGIPDRAALELETGAPLDTLLWNAKFWEIRKRASKLGMFQGGDMTLEEAWKGLTGLT